MTSRSWQPEALDPALNSRHDCESVGQAVQPRDRRDGEDIARARRRRQPEPPATGSAAARCGWQKQSRNRRRSFLLLEHRQTARDRRAAEIASAEPHARRDAGKPAETRSGLQIAAQPAKSHFSDMHRDFRSRVSVLDVPLRRHSGAAKHCFRNVGASLFLHEMQNRSCQ